MPRTGSWQGVSYELKSQKKLAKKSGSTTPDKKGYAKLEDESEGA